MIGGLLVFVLSSPSMAQEHHVVRPGEDLDSIARAHDTPPADIRDLNGLDASDSIPVGAILSLSGAKPDVAAAVCGLTGTAVVFDPSRQQALAVKGQELIAGSEVCTATDSFATVCMARDRDGFDHDTVTMYPNTCLTVESSFSGDTRRSSLLSMSKGQVSIGNGPGRKSGDLTVTTRDGVISGDKGGYRVAIEDSGTRTEAFEQSTRVIGAGVEVTLAVGQGNRVRVGEAPTSPISILVAGELTTPEESIPLKRPIFSWVAADRAVGYRIELAASPDFVDIVYMKQVGQNEWRPEMLMLPYRVPGLWWRVSKVDRLGFVGTPSAGRSIVFPQGVGP